MTEERDKEGEKTTTTTKETIFGLIHKVKTDFMIHHKSGSSNCQTDQRMSNDKKWDHNDSYITD